MKYVSTRGAAPVLGFGDVLAAPPSVARPLLLRALARFEALPVRWAGTVQSLFAALMADVVQMVKIIDTSDLDELDDEGREQLRRLAVEAERKAAEARKLVEAAQERARVRREGGR